MTISTYVVSVGTAGADLVPPTVDAALIWLENIEPSNEIGDFSRDGYAYMVSRDLTIANNGVVRFSFTTGSTGAQIDFWEFDASGSNVLGELIEGATITTTGTAVPAYNLNRNFADDYEAVLETATAITGGTVVLTEFIVASNQAGGGASSSKLITLEPNTEYGFRFTDVGGNGAKLHIQIGWVEKYNGYNDVWINNSVGNAARLRGGDKIQIALQQSEGLSGFAIREGVKVAVMRQD